MQRDGEPQTVYRLAPFTGNNPFPIMHDRLLNSQVQEDQVGVSGDPPELHDWKNRKSRLPKKILTYALLALIPVAVFTLLLWVARKA